MLVIIKPESTKKRSNPSRPRARTAVKGSRMNASHVAVIQAVATLEAKSVGASGVSTEAGRSDFPGAGARIVCA